MRKDELSFPAELHYTQTHEWVRVEGNIGIVGITQYAVIKLTDLVHIDLPKKGTKVEQGSPFGEIESVKTVAEISAPVSGEIIEVNSEVMENVEIVSDDPYEDGWLIKVKMSDTKELESLMNYKEYKDYVKTCEEEEEEGLEEFEEEEEI
jgi:glycine cleavage system H protein